MLSTSIYTIGYGAREIDDLLRVIKANDIHYLLDVRSRPYSKYKPEFSKVPLQRAIEAAGIRYLFIGDSLGGQPDLPSCYTDGKVDYAKVETKSFYKEGIQRLHNASQQRERVVLMCSEGKPENCHRAKLIGQTLTAEGVEVLHIDEKDEIVSQEDVLRRLSKGQPSLFGDDFLHFTSRKRYRDSKT